MSPRALDPEVVELLAEVAQATGSKLFRITSEQRRRQPLESVRVSAATAGLSPAERQLVQVHRAELARLLHEAFWIVFPQESEAAQDIELFGEAPQMGRWSKSAEWAVESLPASPTLADGVALLERCLAREGSVHAGDLLLASMRLVDTEQVRNDVALDLIARGQNDVALATLREQLSKRLSNAARGLVWLNLGHTLGLRRELQEARQSYAQASRYERRRCLARLNAFALSLRMGDAAEARRWSQELDEHVSPSDERVEFFTRALCRARFGEEELRCARSVLGQGAFPRGKVSAAIAVVFSGR